MKGLHVHSDRIWSPLVCEPLIPSQKCQPFGQVDFSLRYIGSVESIVDMNKEA